MELMKLHADREKVFQEITAIVQKGKITTEGGLKFNGEELGSRIWYRLCDILYATGIAENFQVAETIIANYNPRMCHFTPAIVSRLYRKYETVMSQQAKEKIKDYLLSVRDEFMGHDLDFIGVNDNFPMMSTLTAMNMAAMFDDDVMQKEAERRLKQLECLLKRRGVLSEYTSVVYSALQINVLARLTEYATCEAFKTIAQNAQIRVWADLISHYHPFIGRFAGPNSRAYIGDTNGATIFETKWFTNLLNTEKQFFPDELKDMESIVSYGYYNLEEFTLTKELFDFVHKKEFPMRFLAKSEFSASTDSTPEEAFRDYTKEDDFYEYPAGVTDVETYMTRDYAVGTATKDFHNGVQTNSFTLIYKRTETAESAKDVRNVFCRYLINDAPADKPKPFVEQGRNTAFQKDGTAMVLYKPKIKGNPPTYLGLSKAETEHYKKQEIPGNVDVSSLKLSIFFPLREGNEPDEIRIGDKVLSGNVGASVDLAPVFVKDGGVYLSFQPLFVTDKGRKAAVTVTKEEHYIIISFYNYEGEVKDFKKRDFLHIRNGFVFSVKTNEECPSFDAFVDGVKKTKITDRLETSMHQRQTYIRAVTYESENMKLSCEYSPASEGIKHMACNDFCFDAPKLYISNFDYMDLPYMKE